MTTRPETHNALRRMKRSRILHLSSLMATASFTLAACGSPPQQVAAAPEGEWDTRAEGAFRTVEECKTSGTATAAECDAAYQAASTEAAANAPKFASKVDCEQASGVGQCEERVQANGSSVFMPMLAGFLLGRMLSNGTRAAPSALFRQNGDLRTANGTFAGRTTTTQRAEQKTGDSRAVARGGFGGSRGGYGG
ncbi:DUF1190 domain-containing protein [Brevundimonas sp. GN22]